jgi:hypothetical protein
MEIIISPTGDTSCIYAEDLDIGALGDAHIRRVSHCEPDEWGLWWADLSPVSGPRLGPFGKRSIALAAEVEWLRRHVLRCTDDKNIPVALEATEAATLTGGSAVVGGTTADPVV